MFALRISQIVQAAQRRKILGSIAARKHGLPKVPVGVAQDDALKVQARRRERREGRVLDVLVLVKRDDARSKPLGTSAALRARPSGTATARLLVVLKQRGPHGRRILSSGLKRVDQGCAHCGWQGSDKLRDGDQRDDILALLLGEQVSQWVAVQRSLAKAPRHSPWRRARRARPAGSRGVCST